MPSPLRKSRSSSSVWMPTRAAISAPVAVPVIILGNSPLRCNALTTPRWQSPNIAPPCSTNVDRPKACRVSCSRSSFACDVHPCSLWGVVGSIVTYLTASATCVMYSSMSSLVPAYARLNSRGVVIFPRLRTSPERSRLTNPRISSSSRASIMARRRSLISL